MHVRSRSVYTSYNTLPALHKKSTESEEVLHKEEEVKTSNYTLPALQKKGKESMR